MKLEKPIEVLFEGADEDIFKPLSSDEIDKKFFDWLNDEVPEKFAFLHVGQWTKGDFGEDRKDIGKLIKVFYESFANKKKQPALILKTNGATYSILDREECKRKMNLVKQMFPKDWKLPNVYLLHGDLSDIEMNYLYNHPKVKSFISFTHGEGFGRPLLEATMTGLPVMASGWSGQLDFLDSENSILLSGKMKQIPQSAVWKNILLPESQWFCVDENKAYEVFNYFYENVDDLKKKAKKLMNKNKDKFTLNKMSDKLNEIISSYTKKDIPKQVQFNLPKVNSVEEPKLPKLKKV